MELAVACGSRKSRRVARTVCALNSQDHGSRWPGIVSGRTSYGLDTERYRTNCYCAILPCYVREPVNWRVILAAITKGSRTRSNSCFAIFMATLPAAIRHNHLRFPRLRTVTRSCYCVKPYFAAIRNDDGSK